MGALFGPLTPPMCNLYSLTKGQTAIRDWFRARNDRTGNLPLFPRIFPDQMAPIVRMGDDGERELVMARWSMPGRPQYGGAPVTNIRNLTSTHWQRWLGRRNRCLVPATSFLRVRGHEAAQDTDVVRPGGRQALVRLCRPMDALEWRSAFSPFVRS